MPCASSNSEKIHPKPFVYNPYEIGFCCGQTELIGALVSGVIAEAFRDCLVGRVVCRGPEVGSETARDAFSGVNLFVTGNQQGLQYPSVLDSFVGSRPLLDCDVVFTECVELFDGCKVVVAVDGVQPVQEQVLAYVGPLNACPILAPDQAFYAFDDVPGLTQRVCEYLVGEAGRVPLRGLVLAGGHSSRMQSDKARIDYHGRPQVLHALELLRSVCVSAHVSIRPDQIDEPFYAGLPLISDTFLGHGQMGAILTALTQDPRAAWLVLACDMPFVDHEVLRHLIAERNPFRHATAFANVEQGFPEPLCTIYEPKSIHRMLAFLAAGYDCPRKMLINSRIALITPPESRTLQNVNNPDERDSVRRFLATG
ncbi:MAG: hypothetical protein AMXMBFR84_13250 [Candidatus Hydrogenedentota bacterium]